MSVATETSDAKGAPVSLSSVASVPARAIRTNDRASAGASNSLDFRTFSAINTCENPPPFGKLRRFGLFPAQRMTPSGLISPT
jgi:hypothetical protein